MELLEQTSQSAWNKAYNAQLELLKYVQLTFKHLTSYRNVVNINFKKRNSVEMFSWAF